MRLHIRIAVIALAAWGCASPAAETEPRFEFGKVRAKLNGSDFVGVFGPDSVIAIWDTIPDQMQIEGDKPIRGRKPLVRVLMRCSALPKPGIYAIKNPFSPVSVEAFLQPTAWQLIWPLRGGRSRAFLSDSMPTGTLTLESVDPVNGIIKGRFAVSLRSFNRSPAETLDVRGTFFGRLQIEPRFPRPSMRWSPLFERDCERIRNAISI